MLRKVLRRSATARVPHATSHRRSSSSRLLVHTNACKQEDATDADNDRTFRTRPGVTTPSAAARATSTAALFETDHRSLFSAHSSPSTAARSTQRESPPSQRPSQPPPLSSSSSATHKTAAATVATYSLSPSDLDTARSSLRTLYKHVHATSAVVDGESEYQRDRRLQKAFAGPLDKLLYRLRQQRAFTAIDAIANVFSDALPQFATNRKHQQILHENVARSWNQQQRCADVIDRFFPISSSSNRTSAEPLLSPALVEAIWLATGHVGDSTAALALLTAVRSTGMRITKPAYFHLLHTLLKDAGNADDADALEAASDAVELELVFELCGEIVDALHDTVPLSLVPTLLTVAAHRNKLEHAMRFYSFAPHEPMNPFTEFRLEICLQTLCDRGYATAMLAVYHDVIASTTATRGLKERISKCLLHRCVRVDSRNGKRDRAAQDAVVATTIELLETMETHAIAASHPCIFPLLRTLLETGDITTVADLQALFARFPFVLHWNAFALCEAVIACVYCERVQLVDELFVLALDSNIPIKYAALERVLSFYYKLGMLGDLEKVADMIHALRLNKHIPLGIAVTEIGMASNLRLGRFDEVIHLFEDFAAIDGDRKRILQRRLMLKSALKAYAALNRLDESNALRTLLDQSYGGHHLLEKPTTMLTTEEERSDGSDADDDHSDYFTESIDKIES